MSFWLYIAKSKLFINLQIFNWKFNLNVDYCMMNKKKLFLDKRKNYCILNLVN